jgi:hypothetical protein
VYQDLKETYNFKTLNLNEIDFNNISNNNKSVINDGPILRFIVDKKMYLGELKFGNFIIEENGVNEPETFGIIKNCNSFEVACLIALQAWDIENY